MSISVQCEGIWKAYHNTQPIGIKSLLTGKALRRTGRYAREWALKDINFNVPKGSALGIVGHNGSGKSTMLALLLGVIFPDKGHINIAGRVASLLELGSGFHHELTGHDNIYLYGSILGMTLREIRSSYDAIVDFSELGPAVDYPLRTYSAGMIARLGFATIIHFAADVLLIDEVLAVGDASFREKCTDYLLNFKRRNGTLVIVSHDMPGLNQLCDEGLCLDRGVAVQQGPIANVVKHYEELIHTKPNEAE